MDKGILDRIRGWLGDDAAHDRDLIDQDIRKEAERYKMRDMYVRLADLANTYDSLAHGKDALDALLAGSAELTREIEDSLAAKGDVIHGDFRGERETVEAMEQELNEMLRIAGDLSERGDASINSTGFWYAAADDLVRGANDLGAMIRQARDAFAGGDDKSVLAATITRLERAE